MFSVCCTDKDTWLKGWWTLVYSAGGSDPSLCVCVGLKAGDEILAVNTASVSTLDLGLIHTLFSEQTLRLVLRREESVSDEQGSVWPGCDPGDPYGPFPPSSAPYCPPPPSHSTQTQFSSSGTTSQASSNGRAQSFWETGLMFIWWMFWGHRINI